MGGPWHKPWHELIKFEAHSNPPWQIWGDMKTNTCWLWGAEATKCEWGGQEGQDGHPGARMIWCDEHFESRDCASFDESGPDDKGFMTCPNHLKIKVILVHIQAVHYAA